MEYIEEATSVALAIKEKIQSGNLDFENEVERFENLSKEIVLDEGGSVIACKAVQILYSIKDENNNLFYEERFVKYFRHAIEIYLKPWQVILAKMTHEKLPLEKLITIDGIEYQIGNAYNEYFDKDSAQKRLAVKMIEN
jgi:hypothetical protein